MCHKDQFLPEDSATQAIQHKVDAVVRHLEVQDQAVEKLQNAQVIRII